MPDVDEEIAKETSYKVNTLILGASNMCHIDPSEGVIISSFSGAKLADASELIERAEENHSLLNPEVVVIHLGTNDVLQHRGRHVELMVK